MTELVLISEKSVSLLQSLQKTQVGIDASAQIKSDLDENNKIERRRLIAWLNEKIKVDKENQFYLESLRNSLLDDLINSRLSEEQLEKKLNPAPKSTSAKAKFILLAIAGTVLSIAEGFDGIASILNLFNAVTAGITFVTGLAFAVLSTVVFYGFDLREIAKNLGVKYLQSAKLLDVMLEEVENIENIRKQIVDNFEKLRENKTLSRVEKKSVLVELQDTVEMLKTRYSALDDAREQYQKALNRRRVKVLKTGVGLLTGLLFFSGGFFAGQTLAIAVGSLFAATVAATFPPVIIASVLVGIAAFAIYWFVQKPSLDTLVSRWFGLDKDKIADLADNDAVDTQKTELNVLETRIGKKLESTNEKIAKQEVESVDNESQERKTVDVGVQVDLENDTKTSHTRSVGFFNHKKDPSPASSSINLAMIPALS